MTDVTLADASARRDALDINRSFIVRAPAGSGKTELLIQRAMACLARASRPEEVLVMTFTNKAVNEAKNRLVGALRRATDPTPPEETHEKQTWELARAVLERDHAEGWNLLQNPARLRIVTIDKLNAELAAQLPVLSGLGAPARTEERPDALYYQAVQALFEELEDPALDTSARDALEQLLAFSDNRQERVAPMLVSLLRTRDQWLGVVNHSDPFEMEHVLRALIGDRLAMAFQVIGDNVRMELLAILHSSTSEQHQWAHAVGAWPNPVPETLSQWRSLCSALLTKAKTLRKKVTKTDGFPAKEAPTIRMNALLGTINDRPDAVALCEVLSDVIDLPDVSYPEALNVFRVALTHVLTRLVAHLRVIFESNAAVDFTEVALRAIAALGDEGTVSEALLKQDYLIKHLLIDEFQDTSVLQSRLLERLTEGWVAGDGRSLFLVGDAQQSIYGFRQADVTLFLKLWENGAFNSIPLKQLSLTTNFRSDPAVVEWFNSAFDRIFSPAPDSYSAGVTFSPSAPHRDPVSGAGVRVHAIAPGDRAAEAAATVRIINEARASNPDGTVAVLVRARGHLGEILPALKKAGIRFSCQDIDPLAATAAVNDLVALVRALWHPFDRCHWLALLRAPFVGLSWADIVALVRGHLKVPVSERLSDDEALKGLSSEGRERLFRFRRGWMMVQADPSLASNLPAKVESLWELLGGPACVSASEAKDIETVFGLLRDHCVAGELTDIQRFEDALGDLYASPEPALGSVVHIMTIHKAKGLEFDTVILPGLGRAGRKDEPPLLEHRLLPGGYLIGPNPGKLVDERSPESRLFRYLNQLKDKAQSNEAMRLLYVGITRARRELHLLGEEGALNEDGVRMPPARSFLSLLWPAVASDFATVATGANVPPVELQPVNPLLTPRLPADWDYPLPSGVFVPRAERAELPSESVMHIEGPEHHQRGSGIVERLVGTMYHALMERISEDGLEHWNESRLAQQANSLRAGCRRLGMPEPEVDPAVGRITRLAMRTLNSDSGRWILKHRPGARSERKLAGYINGQWIAADLDRVFEEDGIRWIVDYKTAGHEGLQVLEDFVNAETERYLPQLRRYCDLEQQGHRKPTKCALYFPELDRLVVAHESS